MSSALGIILFPDNDIKYFIYYGTSDTCSNSLWDTSEEAWNNKHKLHDITLEEGFLQEFNVKICTDYGYGLHWGGRATKKQIYKGCDPYNQGGHDPGILITDIGKDNKPDWWPFNGVQNST